jgi:DNA-binding CsgD family transcriptional regulator/ketosteroid isomerase-like protein
MKGGTPMAVTQPTPISEEAAIIALIREETEAFHAMDIDRWMACWIDSERARDVMIDDEMGLVTNCGSETIRSVMDATMKEGLACDAASFTQENHQVSIDRDMAWVVYDGTTTNSRGEVHETFETRVLERIGGEWKIAYSSFVHCRANKRDGNRIAVDADGRVIWASDVALARLRTHPGLTVSAGRLRARRPGWDSSLQDALRRAAKLHGFFHQMDYMRETGRAFRCPVVLGENDEGGIVTCTVTVRDGATYVDIADEQRVTERIDVAATIFGLSPAQTELAAQIASGLALTQAADHLGISPNTARTHLTRIYEKTGVNSQPALVRLLLSVG